MTHKYLSILLTIIVLKVSGQTPLPAYTDSKDSTSLGSKAYANEKLLGDPIVNIQFHYTYEQPDGDLRTEFGNFHNVGAGGLFKMQSNWIVGFDVSYQFGSNVKDWSFLNNLTNSSGVVMTSAGNPADYSVSMRGLSAFGKVGYLFPLSWRNRNSGIMVLAGGGVYYHKRNISTTGNIPTLSEEMKKGYDNLTKGPAVSQFLGYYYNSPNRYYNFYIGVDFMQAFTKSVRGFNYNTRMYDNQRHLDINIGARIGWMIPIYMLAKTRDNEYQFK